MPQPTPSTLMNNPSHSTLHNHHYNVKAFGAVGDGVADDTAAVQATFDAAASAGGGRVVIPIGTYKLTSVLTLESNAIQISGAHSANPDQPNSGTSLTGSINGPLIQRVGGDAATKEFILEDLAIVNTHATGTAVSVGGLESPGGIYRCYIRGNKGIVLTGGAGVFCFTIQNCRVNGGGGTYAGSIGIDTAAHGLIWGVDIAGYERGILARGPSSAIIGGRIENCGTGVYMGTGGNLFRGSCIDINFEACDTAIYVNECSATVISGHSIFGSAGAPSGSSDYGINVNNSYGLSIIGVEGSGSFANYFINVPGAAIQNGLSIVSCYGTPWNLVENRNLSVISCHDGTNPVQVSRAGVVATASLPAAGTSQNGMMVIEDAGAGNRNLIIYAGGERFRIDGGAAV